MGGEPVVADSDAPPVPGDWRLPEQRVALLERRHRSSDALDERLAQALAAAIRDAKGSGPPVVRDLAQHDAEPRGQVAPSGEGHYVADGCGQCGRV